MHTRLIVRGSEIAGVFGLLGSDENSATFALGWTLARSNRLLEALLHAVGLSARSGAIVNLQRYRAADGGFSDIEISIPGHLHLILEAKRGWTSPSYDQLARYAGRMSGPGERRLVSLTAADKAYATPLLPGEVAGIPVTHLSWRDVQRATKQALETAPPGRERLWLTEFELHLRNYVAEQTINSNVVYVVSLSRNSLDGAYTWVDVVERDHQYFHPYGAGTQWPVAPPNYLGFRYDGRLQHVRHVRTSAIVSDLGAINPKWADVVGTHVLYQLGSPMRPAKEVRTGNLFRAARVYCAIDTLLSGEFATISAAREETARRWSVASADAS